MAQIWLSLGTNVGDKVQNLERALLALQGVGTVTAVSPVYETRPWGGVSQPDFLNVCAAASTDLAPRPLLTALKIIERELGREPGIHWGPRLIDLDILFYNDLIYHDDALTIPHPLLTERAFVLVPLADIASDLIHPHTNQMICEHLTQVDTSTVHPYNGMLTVTTG
ncbi:MAG: 2-amino-4-hydroxy-6-hydroxymethyldihydropteridine diphosphokinase [Chloroflexi bacterium]|nr:2-amino-4-hydroxy-6-hydroxymethyldihydropteridine diphosphokinase [Chloroflexota bacterium]MBP8056174.1 2-amino-4-hydroxy-6-hydroxymethyldihydropteridine diphosphokinase [Chloroflexota bacterium]